MRFADRLKKQWANRVNFALKYPKEVTCLEIIKHSRLGDNIVEDTVKEFRMAIEEFTRNAIKNKELRTIRMDVFWSIAYGPLYALLRFHEEVKIIGGRKFNLTKKAMDDALDLVVWALNP
jgi:TetR/AcrR family transcriptional regulator, multidrug resistance operon repressor